ncbi:MAG: thioredoxin [Caldilineaceae bacterium]
MRINSILHTNEQSVDRLLAAGLPVVLVFWSSQSPLAAATDSLLAQAAARYAGKLLIAKIDSSAEPKLVTRFQVAHSPAILFVRQNQVETRANSATPAAVLNDWLAYLAEGGARPAEIASSRPAAAPQPQAQGGQPGTPITLTDANFAAMVNRPEPVLVDFWAPWCGPCRMVAPAVEQLARDFQGRAVVGKLNVDENPRVAQQYNIMGIPALYIFKNGQVVDQMVGAQPPAVLQQRLARQVSAR